METNWKTCRANRRSLAIWFAVTSSVSALLVIGFCFIDFQAALFLLGAMSLIIAVCGRTLLRARFRYNDQQIQFRYFRDIQRTWDDVASWSILLSSRPYIFIRFSDGVTVASNQWVLNEQEIRELMPILFAKTGEPRSNHHCPVDAEPQFDREHDIDSTE